MTNYIKIIFLNFFLIAFMIGCQSNDNPNYQYFPNMYEPAGYEPYYPLRSSLKTDSLKSSALQAPKGTVSRGNVLYNYTNNNQGYENAKKKLTSPYSKKTLQSKQGKELYNIYCAICHGEAGDGQGILVKNEVYLGVPNYKDRDITLGSIYHVIYYGKNAMGSYANQLTEKERWQVANYVTTLKEKLK